mmetsp:Transcript_32874/g.32096  ORF Transcript_32874/g.32096 Transcript_32874/m.32096 type:complete len:127 (-) Transcript_32874:292-672(-)
MEIIKNFQNDPKAGNAGEIKDMSFMMKSGKRDQKEIQEAQGLLDKGKIMVHNKITKTFVANTPDQSCDKYKKVEKVRQRDKKPQTRHQSPLLNDLNSYMIQKDCMVMPKIQGATNMHLNVGLNPPP